MNRVKKKPNHKHWYAYDVEVDGDLLVTDSRDPEHDLARVLLARGITGKVTIHDGNTGKPRAVVTIEKAAQLCCDSNGKVRQWKPYDAAAVRGCSLEEPTVVPTMPLGEEAA